jgi:hypothetical protein
MTMWLDSTSTKSDLANILNLIDVVSLQTPEDVFDFVASFYLEANSSARLHLGIREL